MSTSRARGSILSPIHKNNENNEWHIPCAYLEYLRLVSSTLTPFLIMLLGRLANYNKLIITLNNSIYLLSSGRFNIRHKHASSGVTVWNHD